MFKGFNNRQQNGFPSLSFGKNDEAYNFNKCILWLDAAYGTSTVVNGANVSSWVDKINGVIYSQGTAGNQPTYVASDASFNNLPAINFGSNNLRVLNGSASFGLGSLTHAIVVRNTLLTANNVNIILGDGGFYGFGGAGSMASATGFGFYQSGTAYTKSNIEDTSMHIVIFNRNYIIVDGVNQTSQTDSRTLNFSAIGSTNSNCPPNCILAEVLTFDYLMSTDDAIQLSSNINAKYLKY